MGNQLGNFGKTTATIANAATTSDEVDCVKNGPPAGLQMPAAFDGTTMTFTVATTSGGTFQNSYKDGADVSLTVAAAKFIWLDPAIFYNVKYMKLVSGSSETAARSIEVVHRNT